MTTDETRSEAAHGVIYNAWDSPPVLDPLVRICPNCLQYESPERYGVKAKTCEHCGSTMFGCATA